MDNKIKMIECLNKEIIELKSSKEYKLGKNIINGMKIKQIKSFLDNMKARKYNAHGELENNFSIQNNKNNNLNKCKIVIYSCITGNYDKIIEPFYKNDNIKYIMYTDNEKIKSKDWEVRMLPQKLNDYNNILKNRYLKMHPHEFFKDFDYSIYVDGNVHIISDLAELVLSINETTGISMHRHQYRNCIYKEAEVCRIKNKGNYKMMKKQLSRYREQGFPENFGMLEATIIVTDLKNIISKRLLNEWWEEFLRSESLRDQLSLHYIIWKNRFKIEDFGNLGFNLYKNPKFRIDVH